MAKDTQMTNAAVNSQALATVADLSNGVIKVYSGTKAATGDSAVPGGDVLLVTMNLGATAGTSSNGVITFTQPIIGTIVADGVATWYRIFKADGTTPYMDGTVVATGGTGNMVMNSTSLSSGAQVSVTSFTHTVAKSTPGY